MKPERSLFDDPRAEAEADARADRDVAEGQLISHGAVRRWLQSLMTGKPAPRPQVGD